MATDSPSRDKTIQERAAFQADFERAAANHEDAECLTLEEILSLQAGRELDPVANEHLTHCSACSALNKTIQVDGARMQEFRLAVRQTQSIHTNAMPARPLRQPSFFEWRLPTAAAAAFASLAMLILIPKYPEGAPANANMAAAPVTQAPSPLQIPNAGTNDSVKSSNQVQIALHPPSGSSASSMQFVSTAAITVKDVAPQIATAAVLCESAVTLPMNAPPGLRDKVTQEASDIVYHWFTTSEMTGKESFSSLESVVYLPTQNSYLLKLLGGDVTVPEVALENGKIIRRNVLMNTQFKHAIASLSDERHLVNSRMTLADGYVLSIDSVKPPQ